jgi:hypothetical protein
MLIEYKRLVVTFKKTNHITIMKIIRPMTLRRNYHFTFLEEGEIDILLGQYSSSQYVTYSKHILDEWFQNTFESLTTVFM